MNNVSKYVNQDERRLTELISKSIWFSLSAAICTCSVRVIPGTRCAQLLAWRCDEHVEIEGPGKKLR